MFNPSPLFSVIIPTYNSEATLPVALKSIIGQTYHNFEILIIDGRSTDNTINIANSYKDKSVKIRIISEKDKGIYDAMNKGIGLALGDWLFFMGSDDSFYATDVLESIKRTITQGDFDVVYGNINSSIYGSRYDGEFTYEKLSEKNIGHQSIFFNKKVFISIGFFNLKYRALADWEHNIRWFFSSKIKRQYVDVVVANYAEGGFSMTHTDALFNKDKPSLLFKYGFFKLNKKTLFKILKSLIKGSKGQNKFLFFIFYKTIFMMNTFMNKNDKE